MRAKAAKDGLTVRAIAGTYNVLIALDLQPEKRPGCLGFSIERTDLDSGECRWLPNMVRFPEDASTAWLTSARAPLQTFRWGDYTTQPGRRYRYRVVARYGSPAEIIAAGVAAEAPGAQGGLPGGVGVEIRTEDTKAPATAVHFNRGAAASKAYNDKFGDTDPANNPVAMAWLSRGLEEALLDFLGAAGPGDALHAVVYEFQKLNLLDALRAAKARGVDVQVVYHARHKAAADHANDHAERLAAGAAADETEVEGSDHTRAKNEAAIKQTGLDTALGAALTARAANPQGAIMHDKYVVRLTGGAPVSVWTGSTNWTDGAIYGQLNVGHAINDATVAAQYEQSFQLLKGDPAPGPSRTGNAAIARLPADRASIPQGITPVFSPQSSLAMIDLYADVCRNAKLLLVSAPFLLHDTIRKVLEQPTNGALRYVMADKAGSFGPKGEINLFNGDPGRAGVVATMLSKPLNDFQGKLLEGTESFHHAGVHVHSKIILADPFGPDPILITGSANFSTNSTTENDSNSVIFRGDTAVADIYATEFMRMFQHYWLRFRQSQQEAAQPGTGGLALQTIEAWQAKYFDPTTTDFRDRVAFVG